MNETEAKGEFEKSLRGDMWCAEHRYTRKPSQLVCLYCLVDAVTKIVETSVEVNNDKWHAIKQFGYTDEDIERSFRMFGYKKEDYEKIWKEAEQKLKSE